MNITDSHDKPVPTQVQDLADTSLAGILALPAETVAPTTARIIERVDQPGRSISGYHPQRLDG